MAAKKRAFARRSHYNLQADLTKLKKAFAHAAKDVKGRTGEMLYDVKGRTGEMLQQGVQRVRDKSSDIQDSVASYTQEQPLKTVGFAILAGVVIGYIIHHK